MTRLALLLVPAAVVAGALLGRQLSLPVAVVSGGLVGAATAALLWAVQARRVRLLATHVNGWLVQRRPSPVRLPRGRHWAGLEVALNAVGAAYHRRGEKLRRERPWRRDLVDAVVGPALLFAEDGRLVAANREARERLGLPGENERPTLLQALGSSALADAARQALARGRRVEVEATVGERELRAMATVVGDEVLVVLTDRTRERRIEAMRRDFVANASHELKTPVAAIQTLTEALEVVADQGPDRVRSVADRLHAESERLVRTVSDLLDLRRLEEAGELQHAPVDLAAIVREVTAEAGAAADRAQVRIDVDVPARATVAGVAGDLRLVVENLVRNAVQYNRPGGTVEVVLRSGDGAQVLVVSDRGVGISQQDLPRIFERFYRVDDARSRETGGTGLGLAIVKHAVERQGGTVRVDSLLGEGTTVTVRLPVEPPR